MAQKVRVFKIAQDYGTDNNTVVAKIRELGIEVKNYMSTVTADESERILRALRQDREENTVEEHIRPTVVRRRSKGGAPAKPAKAKPPQKELAELPPIPAKETPAVEEAVVEKAPAKKKRVAKPKVAKAEKVETAVEAQPEAEVVAEAPVEEPAAPVVKRKKAESVETEVEPQVVEAEPEPSVEPAELEQPAVESAEVVESEKDDTPKIEIAEGPTMLRPSSEAPVIKRRIVVTPETATPTRQRRVGEPRREFTPAPADATAAARGARPARGGVRRKREVEQRDISPSRPAAGPGRGFGGPGRKRRMAPGKRGQKTELTTPKASKRVIKIEEQITLQELARRMGVKATELLMQLIGLGVSGVNINTTLDFDTAKIVASEFEYDVENVAVQEDELLALTRAEETDEEKQQRTVRPPVVTVMGHVDHGKTSLLDKIRKADVVSGEAGGITQHIGAYQVKTSQGKITFVDTPGHAAFTAMRARGANVTDIVVLVTAADDGVMPQTVEAINHSQAAGVPIIVAINKCDLPGVDPDRVRRELLEHGLVPEDLGGDIIVTEVSAKTGAGVDKLLEMLILQAEVMELSANNNRSGNGVILEAYLDKGRGPVANVLVQDGTLRVGDVIVAGAAFGKIRAMTDEHGKKVAEAGPATPLEVLGLSAVPGAGEQFDVVEGMKLAEKVAKTRVTKHRASLIPRSKPSLEALYEQMQGAETAELKAIIKADVQGSVEALTESFQKLSTEKVKLGVVHSSVGGITESDVLLASTSGAIIVGFNVRPAGKARKVAEEQGVEIRLYSIIYEALEELKKAMAGLLEPIIKEEALGQAEVRDTFTIPKIGTIAGSYVTEGKLQRNAKARLVRDSVQIWEGRLGSLRRFKDDVKEVATGFECGIGLEGYNDVKVGDVIEVYIEKEIAATL